MQKRDELVLLTKDLIRFRSTNDDPEGRAACLNYIENFFEGSGLTIARHERGGIASLFISKGTKKPTILLYGHYDVVPGEQDQFEPHEADGRLRGRGAFDMKSGLAIFMNIMKDVAQTDDDIGLMVVGDEEQGGKDGAGYLQELGYGGSVILMPDGGMRIHNLIEKEKGVLRIRLSASGKASHSAYNWLGESALKKLIEAISRIEPLVPALEDHPNDHWVNVFTVGKMESGIMANQVPDTATALCDFRITEHTTADAFVASIREAVGDAVTVECLVGCNAVSMGLDTELAQTYMSVLQDHQRPATIGLAHGSSDARFFSGQGSTILMGQPDGDGHHSRNEWVSIDAMVEYDTIVRAYIKALA